jgi:hypothetical protein
MTLNQYIAIINRRYHQGDATEHTFRGDLQQLIENLVSILHYQNIIVALTETDRLMKEIDKIEIE